MDERGELSEVQTVYQVIRRLCGVIQVKLKLETITGLLVRRPLKAQMTIGGADMWPMTLEMRYRCGDHTISLEAPYIPGSSIKGRMRFIAEHSVGSSFLTTDFKIFQHVRSITAYEKVYGKNNIQAYQEFLNDIERRCVIDELFGYASFQLRALQEVDRRLNANGTIAGRAESLFQRIVTPTRLYVDDFYVDENYVCSLKERLGRDPFLYDFLEEKSENRIDRLTSAADPRDVVRVRAGIPFQGYLKLLVFDVDAQLCPDGKVNCAERNITFIASMLKALEKLGLGAAVSRGYGRVKIEVERICIAKPPRFDEDCITGIGSLDELRDKADEVARKALEGCSGSEG
jgi:CRISPR-associated protein Csm3